MQSPGKWGYGASWRHGQMRESAKRIRAAACARPCLSAEEHRLWLPAHR
jgi:hypothetical protein